MSELTLKALRPFVPSGSDYDASRRLFAALGFQELWENAGYAGFRSGAGEFILQRFDDVRFASNFMIAVAVENLDEWWRTVSALDLPAQFPGSRIKPPADMPWGREVTFIDLAGVCWHVTQDA